MRRSLLGRGRLALFLVVGYLGTLAAPAGAQGIDRVGTDPYEVVYRPDSVEYRVYEGPRFDLIYQSGSADMARRTMGAMNRSWSGTEALVGPVASDVQMPVVINNFTDRSNGIVDPVPFRQEIEAPSLKSDPLMAHAPSWPALVGPHEAVHAAHAEVDPGGGVGALLRPFAPDVARSMNLTAPAGLIEGAAVYRESRLGEGGGRLNTPLFTMKMKAALLSDDPWSLTQMLASPAYTQPFNRHYIGGGHAFEYLAERGDSVSTAFFSTAVGAHNRVPVLGHGLWLGRATGQRPGALRDELRSKLRETYEDELERRAPFTTPTVVAGAEGRNHRRPYWLSDSTLVAYVEGYETRPGFYRIDARSGDRAPLRIQSITEDYTYSLGPDTSALFASRYVQRPLVPRQRTAEVERIPLRGGAPTQLTRQGRAFAPAPTDQGSLYVATNDGPFARWSVVADDGSTRPLTPAGPFQIREIAPSPTDARIAVLVHQDGDQRIYRARAPNGSASTLRPWVDLQAGVIYDISWGPEGRYLLFSGERGTAANIYAHDTDTGETVQLTNVRFGAIEPALSPNGATLAFVRYRHERHDLVRHPFRPKSRAPLPDSAVQEGPPLSMGQEADTDAYEESISKMKDRSTEYAAGHHLVPRMVYPILQGSDGAEWTGEGPTQAPLGLGVGVGVAGSDPLQRWAYTARTWWQDGRLWGEAKLQTGTYRLRPSVSVYNRAFTGGTQGAGDVSSRSSVEERGVNLGLQLPVALQSNVYRSALRLRLDTEARQTRLRGEAGGGAYTSRLTLSPSLRGAYRLQRNRRDVVPNTGLVFQAQGTVDAWTNRGRGTVAGVVGADVYLPFLRDTHTGIRLGTRVLSQREGGIYNVGTFVPRGFDVGRLPAGTFLQFETEVTQPLWYIDDGLLLAPVYAEALSAYGFGESMGRVQGRAWTEVFTSLGAGIQLEARFFYNLQVDLRIGVAYQPRLDQGTVIRR